MTKSMQYLISGKVQGVFLRAWIQERATQLGLVGWVRNVADGKLEVLAQGADEALEKFKHQLRGGTELSRVENVEAKWLDYDKDYDSFQLR
ncbi:MAG: acylphosphatase [Desulfovibrionaceae bacterium]|jgi:acylphosphatase|nr:acylphosphatase [Desulfovibrionaceae bacterium]